MCKSALLAAIAVASIFGSTELFSQETLVKDINTTPAGLAVSNDYSEVFCACGDYLYFAVPGRELWRTDGTPDGTISLGDLNKGRVQGFSGYWTMACGEDETLFFAANDGNNGLELWSSNGTRAGTKMIKDVTPGSNENWEFFMPLGLLGQTYYFLADHDNDQDLDLWKTTGTESTTVMVANFPVFTNASHVASSDTHHFFRTTNPTTQITELWATDGTGINTTKLLENFSLGPSESVGTKIMFSQYEASDNSYSLWSSDGTHSGTVMVKDFNTQHLQRFNRYNDKLVFGVYSDTWISDGTEAGTVPLTGGTPDASIIIGNEFYAVGYDFSTGFYRLFKTDGNAVETINLSGSEPTQILMLHQIPSLNSNLYLQYFDESVGQEVGFYNLNTQAFSLLKDINPGPNNSVPRAWATLNDKVYFLSDDGTHGTEIWSTDGTEEGTYLIKDILSETGDAFNSIYYSAVNVVTSEGKLQLMVEPQAGKSAIYTSDGTAQGTNAKVEFNFASATLFGKVNNDLIYFNDRKFYKTNAATDELTLIRDLANDVYSLGYLRILYHAIGDKLVFRFGTYGGNIDVGDEFWVTDGTEAGTHILKDINPGEASGVSAEAGALIGPKIIFQGTEPNAGSELWITDGTTEGTVLLKDIAPGAHSSAPQGFITLGNKVIFGATDDTHGAELWITDGTAEGTTLLSDLVPGPGGSEARHFRVAGEFVFFSAYDSERGWTLWKTNGTSIGTIMVADVIPGNDKNKYPNNLNGVCSKFYFAANDGVHGQELWVTDGTETGTHIIDIVAGPSGSNPSLVTDINGVAYFKADAALWRTNGYQQGTFKVSTLEPFNLTLLDNWIYFTAMHPEYGIELFKVEFTKVDQQIMAGPFQPKTFGELPFNIDASATSGLPVAITSSEELAITNKTAAIAKPGLATLTFVQQGDALFNSTEAVQTFCILPSKPSITISGLNEGEPVLTSNAETGNQWFEQDVEIADASDKTFVPEQSGTFKVKVSVDGCSSVFSDEAVVLITALETGEDLVTCYPNPAQHQLKIQATSFKTQIQINILDIHGKPIDDFKMQANETMDYSLQNFPAGIYFIKVITPLTTSYQKFVKE
jgi:ELWxxDGT repeat protein